MKTKTIVKSVRLPQSLYDLTMSANVNKTFTEVIVNLLNEKYGFSTCKQEEHTPCKQVKKNLFHTCAQPPQPTDIEQEVDEFLSCLQRKKDGEKY